MRLPVGGAVAAQASTFTDYSVFKGNLQEDFRDEAIANNTDTGYYQLQL